MKRIFGIFISFVLLFSLNIDAKESRKHKNRISEINLKSDVDISSNDLYDIVYSGKKAFKNIINLEAEGVELVTSEDGKTKTYTRYINNSDKSYTMYTEKYKKIDSGWFNYFESIEIGNKVGSSKAIDLVQSFEYYLDQSKCTSEVETLVNDNCQSKNIKETKYSVYLNNYHIYEQLIIKYDNNVNQSIDAFSSFVYKSRYNDTLETDQKILVKRDSKNRVVNATVYEYYGNKLYMKMFLKEPELYGERYDVMSIYFDYEKDTFYDDNGNVYSVYVYDSNGHTYVTTYTRGYYSGKKVGKNVVKYNYNDRKYYHSKTKYKSNGQKSRYISYKFKYGKKYKRYEYVYNKNSNLKGNAYKYITTYKMNKKGNMVKNKSYKYYYNKKGKVYKKITLKKHPVDFYVEQDDEDIYW